MQFAASPVYRYRAYRYRPSFRTRAVALVMSLGTCALILFMLIRMGALFPGEDKGGGRLVAISLTPKSPEATATKARAAAKAVRPDIADAPIPRVIQPQPPRPTPVPPLQLLKLTRNEFAAADISKMARPPAGGNEAASGGGSSGASAGESGAKAQGPGEGPGGAKLYNAEWYREPTPAEMATYMPLRAVGGGWAMIACRTEERNRVSDCRELGESPRGSGLSRAMRQAAWQFLVRPPRIDGKPLIGAWVRIRFDFKTTTVTQQPLEAPG